MLQELVPESCSRRQSMDPVSQILHLEDLPTPGCRFELQELLGEGTYSKVYAALDKQNGIRVAVKIIENIAENILEIESEYRVLSTIGGQSLVPEFYGTYLHSPKNAKRQLWFVMEISDSQTERYHLQVDDGVIQLCDGEPVSSLLYWLRSKGRTLQEDEISVLLKVFMTVLNHLHQNDIIHRDIRSSNFIISPEGDVKLIDYGSCALVKDSDGKTHSSVGAPYWMAPEVIACEQLRPYTKTCDVWSLGITAIELAETQPPLFDIHPIRAMFQIARNPPPTLKKTSEWSETFKDFISECLERNPEHRPCVLELLLHPFIGGALDQGVTMQEHLHQDYVPTISSRDKQVLKRIGEMVSKNLHPKTPSKPMTVTVKNWNFKSDADSPHRKKLPDDLAAAESISEESIVDHLLHRFTHDEIYSYIGDVLIAINPKNRMPIYEINTQSLYREKARSDNPPHVFAVADRAYQHMLHHKRSQIIIMFGKCNSGKSFSTTQILNHLAFLSLTSDLSIAEKIQHLCPLLDAFGSAKTTYNNNASRLLKTIKVTFAKTGKITGGVITAILLDRTRISDTPENESNFHALYYIYEGLKAEKRLSEFSLDKLSSMKYLPQKKYKSQSECVSGYKAIYQAFRTLAYTEEEILVILRILSAILLLGDVTYTMKGASATANNPYLISSAAKNLSISTEKLFSVVCQGTCIEDTSKRRDVWVQFIYLRMFEWIVASINKQLSFSRLVLGDSFSVSIIDPPGFGASDPNQLFRMGSNVIDDFLQNYMQQLMFFKELEEYKEESVEIPFKFEGSLEQQQTLKELVESERILLNGLQNAGVKGSFNWLKKMKSLPSHCVTVENDNVTVHHLYEKVTYNIQDLTSELVNAVNEDEMIEAFKSTNDILTAAVANNPLEESNSISEQILELFPKILEVMTEDFPHLVVCLQPTLLSREDIRYDASCVLQQMRAFNIMEIIMIRQKGYARRLTFSEFLNRYKYLAFDFDEEVEISKENCQLLLLRLKMDGWKMGNNKVFLKYYAEEYLTRLYETHVKKIIKIQAMARRFIVKARRGK